MKIILYLFFYGILFFAFSCNNKKVATQIAASHKYCMIIDSIIYEHENKHSNSYLTNNLSSLVNKTGILDQSDKGTIGCTYRSDSLFYSDMNKFKIILNCYKDMSGQF